MKEKRILPKVLCLDKDLLVYLSLWLQMPISYLDGKKRIGKVEEKKVLTAFAKVLQNIGVYADETCLLNNYDKRSRIFQCCENSSKKCYNIKLSYCNPESEINIYNDLFDKTYSTYFGDFDIINLVSYKTKSNKNTLTTSFSCFMTSFDLDSDMYNLELIISNSNKEDKTDKNLYVYSYEKKRIIENYLLNLYLPDDINSIYENLVKLRLDDANDRLTVSLTLKNKLNNKTSYLNLVKGNISEDSFNIKTNEEETEENKVELIKRNSFDIIKKLAKIKGD